MLQASWQPSDPKIIAQVVENEAQPHTKTIDVAPFTGSEKPQIIHITNQIMQAQEQSQAQTQEQRLRRILEKNAINKKNFSEQTKALTRIAATELFLTLIVPSRLLQLGKAILVMGIALAFWDFGIENGFTFDFDKLILVIRELVKLTHSGH